MVPELMSTTQYRDKLNKTVLVASRDNLRRWLARLKKLHGNPHYVAIGMAVGVFVAITPTIPFHTIIAVCLSFILRGSKAAAAIGVWFSNPLTIPIFYIASFKTGAVLFGTSRAAYITGESVTETVKLGLDVAIASIAGGIILGILPAIATYFITRKIMQKLRFRKKSIPNSFCNSKL